jgi:peptidoglycan hydrolase CwlO-like protein
MLFIIAASLIVIASTLIYGGLKLKSSTQAATAKVTGFNKQIDTVNKNLQNITTQLQKQEKQANSLSANAPDLSF